MAASEFDRRLRAAQDGDEACFTELFRSAQPRLLRYLRTVAGGLADDVAAETWVSVVRGLNRFSGDESQWYAWVFTIARARLVDAQRRAARAAVPVDVDILADAVPAVADVSGTVEEMFSTESALRLIGTLPRNQAEVVLLRYVAGLDVSRTAEVLGRRPGAVRVTAHRALKRLAGLLAEADDPRSSTGAVTPRRR